MNKLEKNMKKDDAKNIHEGHRQRLGDLFSAVGVDALSDVQAVEYFLTYIFPRGDVNPLAHKLLDEFGDFAHIVDADESELLRIDGLNKRSVQKISNFSELFYYYRTAKTRKKTKVRCRADIIDIVEDFLRFQETENMILLALSAGNVVTHKKIINLDSTKQVSISMKDLAFFLTSSKPTSCVIAHCHPYGKATPSSTDDESFSEIQNFCNACGINFIDSYIVGDDGVFSQREDKLVRTYSDSQQLKDEML